MKFSTQILSAIFSFLIASTLFAQPNLDLVPYASGFNAPVDIACEAGRLYIVEKRGVIKLLVNQNTTLPTPFLDIDARVNSSANERGLLGLVFHPDYANNGYFYVNYNDAGGDTKISRFSVTNNPDVADPNSELVLMTVNQPFSNHNAGDLNFGPDGYLYIGMGDGGSGGDPGNRAQNPNELLGKMLRIDVDGGTPYAIPPDNPFILTQGYQNEIWAVGLRNPWRYSFDKLTGDLWIGDVGQNEWEEINFQPASSTGGENYGWRCYEGNATFNTSGCGSTGNYAFPVAVYPNNFSSGCSLTGGYVYRGGNYPSLYGKYIYCDYCSGNFWYVEPDGNGGWNNVFLKKLASYNFSTFGENETGELYVAGLSDGIIYQLTDANQPLAVELNSFSATLNNRQQQVDLTWTTSSETENDRFEIERSADGLYFEKIGEVEGFGTTSEAKNYSFADLRPQTGTSYYRLKQVDEDGTYTYSEIQTIVIYRPFEGIVIYPNPIKNNQAITLEFKEPLVAEGLFTMKDMLGKTVMTSRLVAGERLHLVQPVSGLAGGVYLMELTIGEYAHSSKMLIQ